MTLREVGGGDVSQSTVVTMMAASPQRLFLCAALVCFVLVSTADGLPFALTSEHASGECDFQLKNPAAKASLMATGCDGKTVIIVLGGVRRHGVGEGSTPEKPCVEYQCEQPSKLLGKNAMLCTAGSGGPTSFTLCGTQSDLDMVQEHMLTPEAAATAPLNVVERRPASSADAFACTTHWPLATLKANQQVQEGDEDPYGDAVRTFVGETPAVAAPFTPAGVFSAGRLKHLATLNEKTLKWSKAAVMRENVLSVRVDTRLPEEIFKAGFLPYYAAADKTGSECHGEDRRRFLLGDVAEDKVKALGGDPTDPLSVTDQSSALYKHKMHFHSCWFVSSAALPCPLKSRFDGWAYLLVAPHAIDATALRRAQAESQTDALKVADYEMEQFLVGGVPASHVVAARLLRKDGTWGDEVLLNKEFFGKDTAAEQLPGMLQLLDVAAPAMDRKRTSLRQNSLGSP